MKTSFIRLHRLSMRTFGWCECCRICPSCFAAQACAVRGCSEQSAALVQTDVLTECDLCMRMQALLQEELGRLSSGITSRIRAGLSRQRSRDDREGLDAARTASGASSGPNPDRAPLGDVPEASEGAGAGGGAQGAAGAAGSGNDAGLGLGYSATAPEVPPVLPPSRRASGAFGSSIFVSGSPSDDSGRGCPRGPSPRKSSGAEAGAARALARGGNGGFGSEVHLAREGDGDDLTAPLLEGTGEDKDAGEGPAAEHWFRNRLLLLLVAGYGLVAFLFNIVDEARRLPSMSVTSWAVLRAWSLTL